MHVPSGASDRFQEARWCCLHATWPGLGASLGIWGLTPPASCPGAHT